MRTRGLVFSICLFLLSALTVSQALPAAATDPTGAVVQVAPDQYEIPVHITGNTMDQLLQGRQVATNFAEKHPELKIRHWDPKLKDPGQIPGPNNPTIAIIIQLEK